MGTPVVWVGCVVAGFIAVLFGEVRWRGERPCVSATPAAFALVGRPATPRSVAGVSRRTTRRVVRRTAIFVPALPPLGCVQSSINGEILFRCGATWYQPSGTQYVVVNVD